MIGFEKRRYFIFVSGHFQENVLYRGFTPNYQELLQPTLNFALNFFIWCSLKKFHGLHHLPANIFHKSVIILTLDFHMELEFGLIFKIIFSYANLNSHSKFCLLALGKRIQEKLSFKDTVSIKSTFLAY